MKSCPLAFSHEFINLACQLSPEPHPHAQIDLTLLATSDVHAQLLPYDYFSDQPKQAASLASVATLVQRLRRKFANTILVDNGDFLQGTPLSDLQDEEDTSQPVMLAMNSLGYDAAALGNHEFNLPLPRLAHALKQSRFPLLCANLAPTAQSRDILSDVWKADVLLTKRMIDKAGREHEIIVGLFGVLPPQVLQWDRSRVWGKLTATDSVLAAEDAVKRLKAAGADIVIGLAHTGMGSGPRGEMLENTGAHIATIPGLDALVLGHSHRVFPDASHPPHPHADAPQGTVQGVPTVMPGASAAYLGQIDLTLDQTATGWSVSAASTRLLSSKDTPPDPQMLSVLSAAHTATLARIRKPVGSLEKPINSFLGLLPGCRSVSIVAEAQAAYVRRKLAGSPLKDLPILSAAAPQKCGGRGGPEHFTDIPAGSISLSHVTDLQFFPNDVSAMRLNGANLRDWLEMAASVYNTVLPDTDGTPLQNPEFPAYNSDTIFGLTYEIDLTQEPRYAPGGAIKNQNSRRIRSLCWQGQPIPDDQDFLVVMNNYRSGGGGYYPEAHPDRIVFQDDTPIRDILITYLSAPVTAAEFTQPWRFSPIKGATARLDTSPEALNYPEQLASSKADILEHTLDGFLKLSVSFEP